MARNTAGDAGRLGLVQMLNHSCDSSCTIIPITLGPGLELFVAEALDAYIHEYVRAYMRD
jgi:hypothetical protein